MTGSDPALLGSVVDKMRSYLQKICIQGTISRNNVRGPCAWLMDTFEDEVRKHGMERSKIPGHYGYREPNDFYFPCILQCVKIVHTIASKDKGGCLKQSTGCYRSLTIILSMHNVLTDLLVRPSKEYEEVSSECHAALLQVEHTCMEALYQLVSSSKSPPNSAWSELEHLKDCSGNSYHYCWDTVPPKAIKHSLNSIAYGKIGASSYRKMIEIRACLRGSIIPWKTILTKLVTETKDPRRCAEMLLWEASTSGGKYAPTPLPSIEVPVLLRRCADGVPPEMIWEFLEDPSLPSKAAEEHLASQQPGYSLEGKWVYGGSSNYTIDRRDDQLQWSETTHSRTLEGTVRPARDEGQPNIPPSFPGAQWSAFLSNGGAIFLRVLGPHALESIYKDNAESNSSGLKTVATKSMESSKDTVVGYCSRLLQTTLQAQPNPDYVVRFKKVVEGLPQLAEGFVDHLEKRFDVRYCNPATIVSMLMAIPNSGGGSGAPPPPGVPPGRGNQGVSQSKISGPNGFLKRQSQRRPSINLFSIIAEGLEMGMPIAAQDCMTMIKEISQSSFGAPDPAGVLLVMSASGRTDFDGIWNWNHGYQEKDYECAFEICSHHIRCVHPQLASASITGIEYGGDSLEFNIVLRSGEHGAAVPNANNCELAQDQNMEIGDRVRVRDHATTDWKLGIVTQTEEPATQKAEVKVRIDTMQTPFTWVYIQKVIAPPPVEGGGGGSSSSAWNSAIKVRMFRNPHTKKYYGDWKDWGTENDCLFVESNTSSPEAGGYHIGQVGCELLSPVIQEWISRWDPRGCGNRIFNNATDLVEQVINGDIYQRDILLPSYWEWFIVRLISNHFRFVADLDAWVLGGDEGLQTLDGDRQRAAQILLNCYISNRRVDWTSTPIDIKKLTPLGKVYGERMIKFIDEVMKSQVELQEQIDNKMLSRSQNIEFERHHVILEANGIQLHSQENIEAVNKVLRGVEHTTAMLRELVDRWGVTGADKLLDNLEETLRQRDLTPLKTIELLHVEVRERLGAALQYADAATSPLLRSHFLKHTQGGICVDKFPEKFNEVLIATTKLTMSTTCIDCVANLDPVEGGYAEGRRDAESRLLTAIGVSPDVIESLLKGALPLRLAVHGLQAFRRLATNPPSQGLKFHENFFDADQDQILLDLDADAVPLEDCSSTLANLRSVTAGCRPHVLRLVSAVLQCGALVDFIRRHPETQDTGLANVLANARDKQHADFQTFLEACTYINPFVAASEIHAQMVKEQEEDPEDTSVMLRPVVYCSGFFTALQDAFAGEEISNMAVLEEMLLTTSEKDKLEALEQLVASKTTSTDALVAQCNKLFKAFIDVQLPPTGAPTLTCIQVDNTELSLAQYKDVIFRATLQKNSDPILASFVQQAKEVLRAFLSCCSLFDEGHLEFRGRHVKFEHGEAMQIHNLLQSIRGQWITGSLTKGRDTNKPQDSLLASAIRTQPILGTLSSAELVRLALLLRNATPISETRQSSELTSSTLRPSRSVALSTGSNLIKNELLMSVVESMKSAKLTLIKTQPEEFTPEEAGEKETISWYRKHSSIEFSEDNCRATRRTDQVGHPPMAVGGKSISEGSVDWDIEILSGPLSSSTQIGVCHPEIDVSGGTVSYTKRWALSSRGKLWGANNSIGTVSGYAVGDVITIHVNADEGTVHFSVNGERKSLGITNVKLPVAPCAVMHDPGMSCRIMLAPTTKENDNNITICGSMHANGIYSPTCDTYMRSDGAVLCPADGGWAVYSAATSSAKLLIASVKSHRGFTIHPSRIGDWRQTRDSLLHEEHTEYDTQIYVGNTDQNSGRTNTAGDESWKASVKEAAKEKSHSIDPKGVVILFDEQEPIEDENETKDITTTATTAGQENNDETNSLDSEDFGFDIFEDEEGKPVELGCSFTEIDDMLLIDKVTIGSIAFDASVLSGHRVLAILFGPEAGRRGSASTLRERLKLACASASQFTIITQSAAVWSHSSSDLVTKHIQQISNPSQSSSAESLLNKLVSTVSGRVEQEKVNTFSSAFSPLPASEWEIRLVGNLYGARVGAASQLFSTTESVNSDTNKSNSVWLLRDGSIYHNDVTIQSTSGALRSGDVVKIRVTVLSTTKTTIEFYINGKKLRDGISGNFNKLYPVVYLPSKGSSATIRNGLSLSEEAVSIPQLEWTSFSQHIVTVSGSSQSVRRRNDSGYAAAIGEEFSAVDHKYAFELEISNTCDNSLFGVMSKGVNLERVLPGGSDTSIWGLAIRSDNGELHSASGSVADPTDDLKFGTGDRIKFVIDFNTKCIDIFKNGVRKYSSKDNNILIPDGTILTPWACLGNNVTCTIHYVPISGPPPPPPPPQTEESDTDSSDSGFGLFDDEDDDTSCPPPFKVGDIVSFNNLVAPGMFFSQSWKPTLTNLIGQQARITRIKGAITSVVVTSDNTKYQVNHVCLIKAPKKQASTTAKVEDCIYIRNSLGGIADGVYKKSTPIYTRQDRRTQIIHWNNRWVVTDMTDRGIVWCESSEEPLGSHGVLWTEAKRSPIEPPLFIRISGSSVPGLYQLQSNRLHLGRPIWLNPMNGYVVSWSEKSCWNISQESKVIKSVPVAFAQSLHEEGTVCSLPTSAKLWCVGDGDSMIIDPTISVVPIYSGETLVEHEGSHYMKSEWDYIIKSKKSTSSASPPERFGEIIKTTSDVNLLIDLRKVNQMVTTETDPMTDEELAGWHIVHGSTGSCPRGPSLRFALSEIAVDQNKEIMWKKWANAASAQNDVKNASLVILQRIGKFLQRLEGSADSRKINNFDATQRLNRYGPISERTIEGNVVDVSRLSGPDARAFGLSLFSRDSLQPHFVLDCTQSTPPEDVHNFIVRYKELSAGRLLVNNVQVLPADTQAEVRQAAREVNTHKELIALITEGSGVDESVEQVDYRCCDIQWKRWAHERVSKLRRFDSVTYFNQKSGSGKSFTIEKKIIAPHRAANPHAPVVILDLDSTCTLQGVCEQLLSPLRADCGLIVVNVAHDSNVKLVNTVLDSLVFFGKVSSPSGKTVVIPRNGWNMSVEVQECDDVNMKNIINILSLDGIAIPGEVLPFRFSEIDNSLEALQFLDKHTEGLKDVPPEEQLRMICRGTPPPDIRPMGLTWDEDTAVTNAVTAEESQKRAQLDAKPVSVRSMARVARLLATRFVKFASTFAYSDHEGVGVREVRSLVAETMRHAAYQYIDPTIPDMFHLRVSDDPVPTMMLLSGKVPQPIEKARDAVRGAIQNHMRAIYGGNIPYGVASNVELVDLEQKPLYSLVEVLATEMSVAEKATSSLLTEKGYVLISDFLQKMLQLSEHIELNDTSILQGPSGTGKSFCVSLLAALEQLSKRHGFEGLSTTLVEFIRSQTVKELFPESMSDQVGDVPNVLWNAVNREDYQNVFDVLDAISDRPPQVAVRALDIIRKALLDLVGPMLSDPRLHPEVSQKMYETDDMLTACTILRSGCEISENASEDEYMMSVFQLKNVITNIVHALSRIGRAYMTQTVVGCVEECIEREVYPAIIDDERLITMIKKEHLTTSLLEWARDVPIRCGERTFDVLKSIKQFCRSQLSLNRLLKPCAELKKFIETSDEALQPKAAPQKLRKGKPRKVQNKQPTTEIPNIAQVIEWMLACTRADNFKSVLMSYDMTPDDLFQEVRPIFENASECPSVRFIVFIDEMNASGMMGLLKRLVVDRSWSLWGQYKNTSDSKIPTNISFVCAVNPHKKDVSLEGATVDSTTHVDPEQRNQPNVDSELGFDVQALPTPCKDHVIPWKQLSDDQRDLFVARRLGNNRSLFSYHVPTGQIDTLAGVILTAHKHVQQHLIQSRSRSTVSQRDIHRTMKLFDFFFDRNHDFVTGSGRPPTQVWHRALSAMLAAASIGYYFRLIPSQRILLAEDITQYLFTAQRQQNADEAPESMFHIPEDFSFSQSVQRAVDLYCCSDHMKLPEAVFQHQGLMENLFAQLVCFHLRLGVILHGAPGTSKTLSNNIIRDNMTGRGDFMDKFAQISEVCRYQGSSQSTADEIKRKCTEALESQQRHDAVGRRNKRSLLFVDEAGLVGSGEKARQWGLKVLHYYLEAGLAAVLMTNDPLDPAISNRCVEVYLSKPCEDELAAICCGILHPKGSNALSDTSKQIIPACCKAFGSLMDGGSGATIAERRTPAELKWWFGLRDLFHLMRFLRRQQTDSLEIKITPEMLMRGLERNFNGLPELFGVVVETFGDAMSVAGLPEYGNNSLRGLARRKLEVVSDSLNDNNRASEGAARNLNDMWVRFKLLVDTTADGTLLGLLHSTKVHDFNDVQVLSLSALSEDELMPVTVVSQIAAAMETGKTVWLTNTRAIDGCLFDVFNQNYQCCTNGRNQVLHFVALAIGATLEYKRVHKNFQAIVHVTRAELSPDVLPSPFLNRLEKFTVGIEDILEHTTHRLPDREKRLAAWAREKCGRFIRCLSVTDRCLFSAKPSDTLDSVVLESIAKGKIELLPPDARIAVDESLATFLWGNSKSKEDTGTLWRSRALRLFNLMRPEGMFLAQRVLQKAPAYVRSYFVSLSPWSIRSYCKHLKSLHHTSWKRTVVYSPDNVDFADVLHSEPYVRLVSLDGMAKAERGAEDLQEEVYRFVESDSLSVFVVLINPSYIGLPIVREVRHLLENPPEDTVQRGRKAVVLLQSFRPSEYSTSCTPLFSTGWDQEYIDASADVIGLDILRYTDSSIVGKKSIATTATWTAIETVLPEALADVDASQVNVPPPPLLEGDRAAPLYDTRQPFSDRLQLAKDLLDKCSAVKAALVSLYNRYLPTPEQLVGMAQEVAARGDESSHSLAALLKAEENKIPCHLATIALRLLLEDRNASALLSGTVSKEVDKLMARALCLSIDGMTFDQLLMFKAHELPPLVIGPSSPRLPGSLALAEQLTVGGTVQNTLEEAKRLAILHENGPVGELIRIIHRDQNLVTAFFTDCLRSRIRHSDVDVERAALGLVLQLARCRYVEIFGQHEPETIWSIRAMCAVEATLIDNFVLTVLPLASTGVLTHVTTEESQSLVQTEVDPQQLCMTLLVKSLRSMSTDGLIFAKWLSAIASTAHTAFHSKLYFKELHCLSITAKAFSLLSSTDTPKNIDHWIQFVDKSVEQITNNPERKMYVEIDSLKEAVNNTSSDLQCDWRVALQLAEIYQNSSGISTKEATEILSLIFEIISNSSSDEQTGLTRGIACRILSNVISDDAPHHIIELVYSFSSKIHPEKISAISYNPPSSVQQCTPVLKSMLYTSVYDVSFSRFDTLIFTQIVEKCLNLKKLISELPSTDTATKLYHTVCLCASQRTFIKMLARLFASAEQSGGQLSIPMCEQVTLLAHELLDQVGWKFPGLQQDFTENLKSEVLDNVNTFLSEVGKQMGTKGLLHLLNDEASSKKSTISRICGHVLEYYCKNSDPLETRPGDLPFVYTAEDPLHNLFLDIKTALCKSHETHQIKRLVDLIRDSKQTVHIYELRLVVFFTFAREFLGARECHSRASDIVKSDIVMILQLSERQQHLLHVFLDPVKITANLPQPVGLCDEKGPIRKGFKDCWTEIMVTIMSAAAAVPDTMLGTFALSVDDVHGTYIVGDRTRSPVQSGGDYKFDCVTQIDLEGQLASYVDQSTMKLGTSYLLWAIQFGALAWQAALWPATHVIMWTEMFSSDLTRRVHGFQQELSDHQLLVANMTERSQTYLTHLGMNVSLTVDEASRLVSNFCYHITRDAVADDKLHKQREEAARAAAAGQEPEATPPPSNTFTGSYLSQRFNYKKIPQPNPTLNQPSTDAKNPLLQHTFASSDEAIAGERHMEAWYNVLTAGCKPRLQPPNINLCKTTVAMTQWAHDREPSDLPTYQDVLSTFRSSSPDVAPLLAMALNENRRLAILPCLVKCIVTVTSRLHTGLSGKIPISEARRPVKEMLRTCYPVNQSEVADEQWKALRTNWSRYVKEVGPIGYQCGERGVITFEIEENAPLNMMLSLPEVDCPLPLHQNIIANALSSLTRIYNDCQQIASSHSVISPGEVDPLLLSPTRPDMTLSGLQQIPDICKSHFISRTENRFINVSWDNIERELSYASGSLLPRLRSTVPPNFKFYDPNSSATAIGINTIEDTCKASLAAFPERMNLPLSSDQEAALKLSIHKHDKTDVMNCIVALNRLFDANDVTGTRVPLSVELQRRQPRDAGDLPLPQEGFIVIVCEQCQAVLSFFLKKLQKRDWETSDLPIELTHPMSSELEECLDRDITSICTKRTTADVLDYIEDLSTTLRNAEQHRLKNMENPQLGIVDVLARDLLMDFEDEFDQIFIKVKCSEYASLRRWLTRTARKLRSLKADTKQHLWIESNAEVPEITITVTQPDVLSELLLSIDDDLKVTNVEGLLHKSGILPGMYISAIADRTVSCREEFQEALSRAASEPSFTIIVTVDEEDYQIESSTGTDKQKVRLDYKILEETISYADDTPTKKRRGVQPVRSSAARGWTKLRGYMREVESTEQQRQEAVNTEPPPQERKPPLLEDAEEQVIEEIIDDDDFPRSSSFPTQWSGPSVPGLPEALPRVTSDSMLSTSSTGSRSKNRDRELTSTISQLGQQVTSLAEQNTELESQSARQQGRITSLETRLQEQQDEVTRLNEKLKGQNPK